MSTAGPFQTSLLQTVWAKSTLICFQTACLYTEISILLEHLHVANDFSRRYVAKKKFVAGKGLIHVICLIVLDVPNPFIIDVYTISE